MNFYRLSSVAVELLTKLILPGEHDLDLSVFGLHLMQSLWPFRGGSSIPGQYGFSFGMSKPFSGYSSIIWSKDESSVLELWLLLVTGISKST